MSEVNFGDFVFVVLLLIMFGFGLYRGRWPRLAERYRTSQRATGKVWMLQVGRVEDIPHTMLTLTTNSEGLYIDAFLLSRLVNPRLFIPWSEFRDAEYVKSGFLRRISVVVGTPPVAALSLPAVIFEKSEGGKVLEQSSNGTNVPAT